MNRRKEASESKRLEIPFCEKCPKTGDIATGVAFYYGTRVCKADLQVTFRRAGITCSLLEDLDKNLLPMCVEDCTIVPEKYL